ncbi:two-component sensor histidine kinase [Burkholderia cenocepacia]|uniref:sensor histidine kinase n=1 Tax=Burkholderia cepacia complex TaxID=87882 RepID=UPI0009C39EA7|nr:MULTISPECIES: ATP-binding protein [Burkholderia cepacia complex]AQT51962.1 two-component sensor histidine kinase [Burkholderia cenocepacia]MBR8398836.1 two-component sensor histidine kinase [Burkholderia cenocepacia]MDN7534271.1 ATP-binding protein [Burkholderia orbicola]
MKPSIRAALCCAWLALSLAGTALVVSRAVGDAYGRFFQDSSIAIRLLGQKAAQHEAILATLGATALSAPPSQMLDNLRARMPQLDGLEFRQPGVDRRTAGNAARRATPPPSHRAGTTFSIEFAAEGGYWLVADTGWAVRVDPRQLLQPGDWPDSLTSATLHLEGHAFDLLRRDAPATPFGWTMQLDKHLPARPQAFVLTTTRTLTLADLPWLPIALWNAVAALMVAGALGAWRLRETRRRERARARIDGVARLDTLGEMAAGLAHELNQPLTAIVTHTRAAERLLDVPDERDSVRRALQTSVAQAKRAAAILDRLRTAMTSTRDDARRALDPDALMASLLFLHADDAAREHVALTWRNATPRERPLADPVAVEQILHNLIRNARDALAGEPRGEIRVSGARAGRHYRFSVVDNGPGVPDNALPRLFEPFFTTRADGLGLGLPLCDTLAQRQDGTLTIRNLPFGGVEAALLLPIEEEHA